jgi:hypothetical protein
MLQQDEACSLRFVVETTEKWQRARRRDRKCRVRVMLCVAPRESMSRACDAVHAALFVPSAVGAWRETH